jgi:hypothetical protein
MNSVALFAWIACASGLVSLLAVILAAARLSKGPRLRSLGSKVDTLQSDYDELLAVVKRMDARDRMRQVRAGKTTEEDGSSSPTRPTKGPDPIKDPVAWKRWMRNNRPASILNHTG